MEGGPPPPDSPRKLILKGERAARTWICCALSPDSAGSFCVTTAQPLCTSVSRFAGSRFLILVYFEEHKVIL